MDKKGFSLIELLIVVAIIAILAGVAVPYYNEYVMDARVSVLQNNLATIRKAINQFKGDNQRGPFRVKVVSGGTLLVDISSVETSWFEELVNGPVQRINGWKRRSNLRYLNSLPALIEPSTGASIQLSGITFEPAGEAKACTCWFYDVNNDNIFDIVSEAAFSDGDGNGVYDSWDVNPFNSIPWPNSPDITKIKPLDYTDIILPFN